MKDILVETTSETSLEINNTKFHFMEMILTD